MSMTDHNIQQVSNALQRLDATMIRIENSLSLIVKALQKIAETQALKR